MNHRSFGAIRSESMANMLEIIQSIKHQPGPEARLFADKFS